MANMSRREQLEDKIWAGKRLSGTILRKLKKLEKASSFVKIETSRCFLDSFYIEQRMSSRARCPVFSDAISQSRFPSFKIP